MEPETNTILNIWLIFLGSFLTFLATFIIEWLKNRNLKNTKTKNFKLLIKQELQAIDKILDKLKTVLEYKNYYDYSILESLIKSVGILENYKKDAIYLNNPTQQEVLIDLILDMSNYIHSVKSIQDLFYGEQRKIDVDIEELKKNKDYKATSIFKNHQENAETFQKVSMEKTIDLIEIKRKLDDFIKSLD